MRRELSSEFANVRARVPLLEFQMRIPFECRQKRELVRAGGGGEGGGR